MNTTLSKHKEGVKVFGLQADTEHLKQTLTLQDLVVPDKPVPVTRNFGSAIHDLIGIAKLYKKEDGLYADITILESCFVLGGSPAIKIEFDKDKDFIPVVIELGLYEGPNIDPAIKPFTFDIIRKPTIPFT